MAAVALFAGAMAALRVSNGEKASRLFSQDKLGVVTISGFIADSKDVTEWTRTLRRDDSVKGVLVRVDTPGGAVAPAQEMYSAIKRLAAVKPVVISMGSAAASGGYYIAVAGDYIVANPATLTGSIGVKMELANMEGLMGKIGISHVDFTSGELKNAGSPFKPMTDSEREYLQGLVMEMYDQFVEAIAEGREMPIEEVKKVADGRAMTGRQALALGLVDELGDMETAFDKLLTLCKVETSLPYIEGPQEEQSFLKELLTSYLPLDPASSLRRRSGLQFMYMQ